jgi:hypothetical protein
MSSRRLPTERITRTWGISHAKQPLQFRQRCGASRHVPAARTEMLFATWDVESHQFLGSAPRRCRARRQNHAGWVEQSIALVASNPRPLASTAQAMRASLLASAIAGTLWCSRFFAASIHDLSP